LLRQAHAFAKNTEKSSSTIIPVATIALGLYISAYGLYVNCINQFGDFL
jgi:hypothetical protein